MLERLRRGGSLGGVDGEEVREKVDEGGGGSRPARLHKGGAHGVEAVHAPARVALEEPARAREVLVCVAPAREQLWVDRAEHAHQPRQQCRRRLVLEEHPPSQELRQDAPERPHVNLEVVRQTQDHLGRTVAPGLDVVRRVVGDEAAAAEVDHFDFAPRVAPDENILGLQVAVDEREGVEVLERLQHLARDGSQARNVEVELLAAPAVVPRKLVQVGAEELADDEEVLLVIKVVVETKHAFLVARVVAVNKLQKLNLVEALVEKVFVVVDDLHANRHARLQIRRLDGFAERRLPEKLRHLVALRHDGVHSDRELFALLEASAPEAMHHLELERLVNLLLLVTVAAVAERGLAPPR
mmetsp:Transcript_5060/g.17563  ORF Transcript_5060/g.17563 Transcript_5060/m.17563 type:complete len:355 (-) Transcript_5060:1221-2285(-)